jgi:hypothetical protein
MQNQFFEGRELKPYGEYVLAADLVAGRIYFKVGFLDDDMAVPQMDAFVYLGRDLSKRLPGLYFQDAPSHIAGERIDVEAWASTSGDLDEDADGRRWERGDDVVLEWQREKKYSDVYEFEGALNSLLGCSLRRQKWDGTVRTHDVDESEEPSGS